MNMPVNMHEEVLNFFSFFFLSLVGSRDNTWITSVIDDDAKKNPLSFFPFPFPTSNQCPICVQEQLHHETGTPSGCPVVRRRGERMRGKPYV